MKNAQWIWCEKTAPNTYGHFRGKLLLPEMPLRGTVRVFADSRYQVWVNGVYVGQGPTPFKRPYLFADEFEVARHLRAGANAVAVLVHYHGVNHCTYTKGPPGLIAALTVTDADGSQRELATNASWKTWVSRAYARKAPRRTWATAWCEYYDARAEPTGWEGPDFDDAAWSQAREIDPGTVELLPRITAPLAEHDEAAQSVVGTWHARPGIPVVEGTDVAGASGPPIKSLTAWLDEEPLETSSGADVLRGPLKIEADNRGLAMAVDLGREVAGQVELEMDGPAGVTLDLCPCENLRDGRSWCRRKGGEYAKRYITRNGRQRWRAFGYDGFRFLHLVIRGPHPEVTIHRLGAWRRLEQISQQTNALAVTAGVCPAGRVPGVLARVLDPQDSKLCRCGTYFWLYLAAALCRTGMHERMWGEVVRLWNEMAEKGATTWWETFLGDELDSLCHIWSSVPGFLILSEIFGVKPSVPGFAAIEVQPRPDLLSTVTGTVPLPDGEVRIAWRRQAPHECEITIHPLTDRPARLSPPPGWRIIPEKTTSISLAPRTISRIELKRLDVPGE